MRKNGRSRLDQVMLREEEKRRRAEWAAITDEPFPEEKLYAFEL